MKILMISNFLSKYNFTRAYSEELALKLESLGYNILKTTKIKNRILKLFDIILSICKYKYDLAIVDLFSHKAFVWGSISAFLLKLLKKRFFIVLRGGDLPEFCKKKEIITRKILNNGDYVISPSLYLKEKMKDYRNNILYIPNAISIENYPFNLREHIDPNIVWLRAFHEKYNPILALKSYYLISKEYKNSHLCMIGPEKDGTLKKVKRFIEEKNLFQNVSIIEGIKKEEVPIYLKKYDIFINSTTTDNFPVSVLEAMALGLCVISTNVGGIKYLIENEKEGLLVPSGNEVKMAEAIRLLLKDKCLCKKISFNARKKAEEFSWEKVLPMWKDIING